jgi:MarR-like DNA-binding transcriptional regulator SgrR of sgrS sRNA
MRANVIIPMIILVCVLGIALGIKKVLMTAALSEKVRVAFDFSSSVVPRVDPAAINSFSQGVLVDNIYSRLVEFDRQGRIQSGIASSFYWKENSLIFTFAEKVRTASGHYIDANDAAVSLRRLLKLGSNTHIDLRLFLCEIETAAEVFKDCPAIRVEEGRLVITLSTPKYKPFLVQTLAAIDFGIIPQSEIDRNSLEILSTRETSGAYHIAETSERRWVLKKNNHYNITESSPGEVHLLSIKDKSAWDQLIDDEVDVVTTSHNLTSVTLKKIEKLKDLEVSSTLNIKLFFVKFSPAALKDFSAKQRYWVARQFRELMMVKYPLPIGAQPSNQFFLEVGFGHLSTIQLKEIEDLMRYVAEVSFSRKMSFYIYEAMKDVFSVFKEIKELDAQETPLFPFMQKPEDRLDVFMGTTDTAYEENLSVLGYNFTQGTFGLTAAEGEQWMTKYVETVDESRRLELIQNLHYEMLKRGVTIPLFKAPYTAVAKNGFIVNLYPLYAGTYFSEIHKK